MLVSVTIKTINKEDNFRDIFMASNKNIGKVEAELNQTIPLLRF